MQYEKKRAKQIEPDAGGPLRVVAVHVDVDERLKLWESEPSWADAAADFRAIIELVEEGDLEAADMNLLRLYRDAVGEGVREYGKRQKGGTLLLFLLQHFHSYFFLAVALKKTNAGAPEIEVAVRRAREIKEAGAQSSLERYRERLGIKYRIQTIPKKGSGRTR